MRSKGDGAGGINPGVVSGADTLAGTHGTLIRAAIDPYRKRAVREAGHLLLDAIEQYRRMEAKGCSLILRDCYEDSIREIVASLTEMMESEYRADGISLEALSSHA